MEVIENIPTKIRLKHPKTFFINNGFVLEKDGTANTTLYKRSNNYAFLLNCGYKDNGKIRHVKISVFRRCSFKERLKQRGMIGSFYREGEFKLTEALDFVEKFIINPTTVVDTKSIASP